MKKKENDMTIILKKYGTRGLTIYLILNLLLIKNNGIMKIEETILPTTILKTLIDNLLEDDDDNYNIKNMLGLVIKDLLTYYEKESGNNNDYDLIQNIIFNIGLYEVIEDKNMFYSPRIVAELPTYEIKHPTIRVSGGLETGMSYL